METELEFLFVLLKVEANLHQVVGEGLHQLLLHVLNQENLELIEVN